MKLIIKLERGYYRIYKQFNDNYECQTASLRKFKSKEKCLKIAQLIADETSTDSIEVFE